MEIKKIGKIKELLKEAPEPCMLTLGINSFAISYVFPIKMKEKVRQMIAKKKLLRKIDGDLKKKDKGYKPQFFWYLPDSKDSITQETMACFEIPEEDWDQCIICARFFERWPDGSMHPVQPPVGEN